MFFHIVYNHCRTCEEILRIIQDIEQVGSSFTYMSVIQARFYGGTEIIRNLNDLNEMEAELLMEIEHLDDEMNSTKTEMIGDLVSLSLWGTLTYFEYDAGIQERPANITQYPFLLMRREKARILYNKYDENKKARTKILTQLDETMRQIRFFEDELRNRRSHDQHHHSLDKHIRDLIEKKLIDEVKYGSGKGRSRVLKYDRSDIFDHRLDGYNLFNINFKSIKKILLDENIWKGLPESGESRLSLHNELGAITDTDWRIFLKNNRFKCKNCESKNYFHEHYELTPEKTLGGETVLEDRFILEYKCPNCGFYWKLDFTYN